MKASKDVCQSCSTPLLIDHDKGTEKDGKTSALYCRQCYRMGSFTEPKMTAETMHEIVRARLLALRFPGFLAKLLADHIYTLERWAQPIPVETAPLR